MGEYLLKRFLYSILSVLGAILVVFLITRLTPGDPIRLMAGDQEVSAEVLDLWRQRYGLDKPVPIQFLYFLRNAVRGDLGTSYQYIGKPVMELLSKGIPVTLKVQIVALILAIVASFPMGIISALKQNSWIDNASMFVALAGISLPSFALATFLIVLFSLKLGWLPVAGLTTPAHYILPAVTLAANPTAILARIVRGSMLEVLNMEYITVAKAKGLRRRTIIVRHALRNAALPALTVLGIVVGRLFAGAFLIETVFSIPGLGRIGVNAVLQRDYPVIMGATVLLAFAFALSNFVTDALYGVFDPRIRLR